MPGSINNARGIIFAYKNELYKSKFKSEEFHLAAREAALAMKEGLFEALKKL